MLQIINISQARNNLARLVAQVMQTGKSVVIVQDSNPAVIVSPYKEAKINKEDYLNKLLSIKGYWFSEDEFKQNRKQINKRLAKTK